MRTRRMVASAMAALIVVGMSIFSAGPAQAAQSKIVGDTKLRSCVTTTNSNCNTFASISNGVAVTMVCWIDGSTVTGNYKSNRWFLIRRVSNGYEGFVHSSRVSPQTSVPNCNNVTRVRAGLEAIYRMGQVYPSASDYAFYGNDWGPYKDWSGDCKKLAGLAYHSAGMNLISGNAKPTMDWYWANRSWKGTSATNIPYGALVGWNLSLPYGHIGVAVGGGRVAQTNGYDNNRKANSIVQVADKGSYRGWVMP